MMLANAFGFWLAASSTLSEPMDMGLVFKVTASYLPAVIAFAGLAAFLAGALPRLISLAWVFLVYSFLAVYIGRTMDLPQWGARATPFGLLPSYPMDAFDWPLAIALVGVSVAIAALGAIVYRQRDMSAL